ncbi:MAG TPA: bifunctional methylenetetrahydrofolate dehydrogenase/methenyltetrahydrofolate cyclohydrolase FolD [Opitutales bacterium]|nr:bifunctional methylenetetrahydrofolate dehydrogenase/methenyltetrahydrofolate cyclohydrolase FolD [Opitutales bacterium]
MAEIIDGNKIAAEIIAELTNEVRSLRGTPCVAFIRVGDDPASVSYVRKKDKTAAEIGIKSRLHVFPETVTQEELFTFIDQLNADNTVHGILVQAPLPSHIDETLTFRRIDAAKDVDGFHTVNLGKLCQEDRSGFVACTPQGIMELLERSNLSLEGKHVVILGRSLIVGKPFALLAVQKGPFANATVTICHSRTKNLPELVRQADVVVAAMGKPEFVTADMIKENAVVIDVGINRVADASRKSGYRLTGDVDFSAVSEKASHITPVPGGVGPMTVALLMKNTVKAYRQQSR